MTTKLIMIDNDTALISTNNLDCQNTYRHFNAGVFMYGQSSIIMYNDIAGDNDISIDMMMDEIMNVFSKKEKTPAAGEESE